MTKEINKQAIFKFLEQEIKLACELNQKETETDFFHGKQVGFLVVLEAIKKGNFDIDVTYLVNKTARI